jgi:Heavy-metal resistance protein CzcE
LRIFADRESFEYRARPIGTAHHDLPIGTTSTQTKELLMKMHLVMAAALAGLCSHAAFARYDGGDTWSKLEPVARSIRPLTLATNASSSTAQRDYLYDAPPRYDGGDTWSAMEPKAHASASQSLTVATTAPLSGLQREYPSVYGTPAETDSVGQIVRLAGGAQSVNVAYGETVKFIVKGENGSERSFAWRFNVSPVLSHVDLSEVAPADLPVRDVRVFVAPDSRYRGG